MSDAVSYAVSDGVAVVTMERPAANAEVRSGLRDAFVQAADDADVRAVVLTGTGRVFCAGQDLKELLPLYEAGDPEFMGIVRGFNEVVTALVELPKPVVAALNGAAAGAGASLAFACDFRIASEDMAFSMAFSKIGLVPDTGASWTLPRLVGTAKALEMIMLSEPVPASSALSLGLVTKVVPSSEVLAEATAFASSLAAGPTVAYGYIKRLVHAGASSSLGAALAMEAELQDAAGRTEDHANAVRSFLAKEPPTFRGY